MDMYRDKIFFERLVEIVSEDIRKANSEFSTFEKLLDEVNATMIGINKFSSDELKEISISLKNAVKDIFDHDEKYACSGIPILIELDDYPELFMFYTKGDYPL